MEQLLEILEGIQPGVDFQNTYNLVDGHHLDSLSILSLVAEIEDEFDVVIPTVEIIPANFNSVESIYALIKRLEEEG